MVRKSQRNKAKARINHTLEEFTPKGLPKDAKIKIESWTDSDTGEVAHYALAYINQLEYRKDNGRVSGYDNSHKYHHRHYKGKIEPIEFNGFEKITERFLDEVQQLLDGREL